MSSNSKSNIWFFWSCKEWREVSHYVIVVWDILCVKTERRIWVLRPKVKICKPYQVTSVPEINSRWRCVLMTGIFRDMTNDLTTLLHNNCNHSSAGWWDSSNHYKQLSLTHPKCTVFGMHHIDFIQRNISFIFNLPALEAKGK